MKSCNLQSAMQFFPIQLLRFVYMYIALAALEQCIDEWCNRRAACQNYQCSESKQYDDDRHEPVFFPVFEETPQVAKKLHGLLSFTNRDALYRMQCTCDFARA